MAKSPYTDLPEPLKTYLPEMFKTYPVLDESGPSSWFVWSGEKVRAYNNKACHSDMYYDVTGWDNLVTAVPNSSDLGLEYLRMLIRGPFRSLSDLVKLDRVKDTYFLHIMSLDKWPANVLMNFCIASRVPIEFSYLLEPWAKRCELGFNPTLAFLLTYSYGADYQRNPYSYRSFNITRPGHMWLDPKSNWSNILNGTFEKVSRPYKTHPADTNPVNRIWGVCDDHLKLTAMSDEEIAEFYAQPVKVFEAPKILDPALKIKYPQFSQFNPALVDWGAPFPNNEPQPQPIENIHEPEDDGDLVDEWFPDHEDQDD